MTKERNQKILKAGDAGVPNAAKKAKDLKLGPVMFPIKKAKRSVNEVNV